MKMIDYYEITGVIEAQHDSEGNVISYDYAVIQYVLEGVEGKETRLMSGSADDFDTAEQNLRVKLANLDRPTL